jgi:hypothetical protein
MMNTQRVLLRQIPEGIVRGNSSVRARARRGSARGMNTMGSGRSGILHSLLLQQHTKRREPRGKKSH